MMATHAASCEKKLRVRPLDNTLNRKPPQRMTSSRKCYCETLALLVVLKSWHQNPLLGRVYSNRICGNRIHELVITNNYLRYDNNTGTGPLYHYVSQHQCSLRRHSLKRFSIQSVFERAFYSHVFRLSVRRSNIILFYHHSNLHNMFLFTWYYQTPKIVRNRYGWQWVTRGG